MPTISTGNPRPQATTKQLVDPGRLGYFGVQFSAEKKNNFKVGRQKANDERWASYKTRFLEAVDCVAQEFMSVFLPPFSHMLSNDCMETSIRIASRKQVLSKPFRLSVIKEGENGLPLNTLTAVCLRPHVMQKDGEIRPTCNSSEEKFEYNSETYKYPSCAAKGVEEAVGCVASTAARY